jgi:hypothetical protein
VWGYQLVNHVNMTWDQEALEMNLIEADVQAVKRVPLGRSAVDIWAWSREKRGLYIVKSISFVGGPRNTSTTVQGGGCKLFYNLE